MHDLERRAEAVADLTRAIELDPVYAPAFGVRGTARLLDGDADRAIPDLTRAVRLDPRYAAAFRDRGKCPHPSGRVLLRDRRLQRGDPTRPEDPLRPHRPGHRPQRRGRPPGAIADLAEALKLDSADVIRVDPRAAISTSSTRTSPTGRSPTTLRPSGSRRAGQRPPIEGVGLSRQGGSPEGPGRLHRGDPTRPERPPAPGRPLGDLGRPQGTGEGPGRPRHRDPALPGLHLGAAGRGRLRAQARDYAGAVDDFRAAIRLAPDDPSPKYQLARIRSSCPDARFRDGKEAVALSLRACDSTAGRTASPSGRSPPPTPRPATSTGPSRRRPRPSASSPMKGSKLRAPDQIELYKQRTPYRDPESRETGTHDDAPHERPPAPRPTWSRSGSTRATGWTPTRSWRSTNRCPRASAPVDPGSRPRGLADDGRSWPAEQQGLVLAGLLRGADSGRPSSHAATTIRLGPENNPEPDASLMILPECGGQARIEDHFIAGAPELIVEVSYSSRAVDLRDKRAVYERGRGPRVRRGRPPRPRRPLARPPRRPLRTRRAGRRRPASLGGLPGSLARREGPRRGRRRAAAGGRRAGHGVARARGVRRAIGGGPGQAAGG